MTSLKRGAVFLGALVADRLRLVHPLGEGGMGSVWVAEHLALRPEVGLQSLVVSAEF